MQPGTFHEEIGFLKKVAAEGGRPFARDGAVLLATGSIWGACSLLGWAQLRGIVPFPPQVPRALLWSSLPLIILLALLLRRNLPAAPAGAASRGMSVAWTALLLAFAATAIGLTAAAIRLRNPAIVWLLATTMFAFYGAGWCVAYAILRRTSYALIAIGCFAITIVTGALAGTKDLWLAQGLGLLILVALPGWTIMREHSRRPGG